MTKIIDTNNNVAGSLAALKADGIEAVIRYISTNTSGEKCVKPAEARSMAAAGIKLGLVFEVWGGEGNFQHGDINADTGRAHGAFARSWAANVGAPPEAIIWFAVDTDATDRQISQLVLPYFRAAKATIGGSFKCGIYGCGAACQAALDSGVVDAAWLSNAMGWNGSRAFKLTNKWTLLQHLDTTLHGLSVDPDESAGPEYGAFIPFGGSVTVPPPTPAQTMGDAEWVQDKLNKLGATPPLTVDGDIGPMSIKAMRTYLESHAS